VKKSLRTLALSAVVAFSAVPMFANIMGTDPHPQASTSFSLGTYLNILLAVTGY
jgi:hypothetical protein